MKSLAVAATVSAASISPASAEEPACYFMGAKFTVGVNMNINGVKMECGLGSGAKYYTWKIDTGTDKNLMALCIADGELYGENTIYSVSGAPVRVCQNTGKWAEAEIPRSR